MLMPINKANQVSCIMKECLFYRIKILLFFIQNISNHYPSLHKWKKKELVQLNKD
jgi:hypothetical protein